MSDIVKLYNPANAAALKPEDLEALQNLTSAEIKQLAQAYPNTSTGGKAYLLIVDKTKPANKQIPTLSTFENLYNIRERNNLKQFVAFSFKGNYRPTKIVPSKAKRMEVLDLSDTELLTLPGFKTKNETHKGETVEVTRITTKETAEAPKKAAKKGTKAANKKQ